MLPVQAKPIAMTPFTKMVIQRIKQIPHGRVATYGQIAALAGKPHGARGVGWILRACSRSHQLPWQRVINSQGKMTFHPKTVNFREQRKLLLGEKVEVTRDGAIALDIYGWKKKPPKGKQSRGLSRMFL